MKMLPVVISVESLGDSFFFALLHFTEFLKIW